MAKLPYTPFATKWCWIDNELDCVSGRLASRPIIDVPAAFPDEARLQPLQGKREMRVGFQGEVFELPMEGLAEFRAGFDYTMGTASTALPLRKS
ncbi:hypothetical protein [Rhizobium lusitanum]|uniref:Uncharacterized protein n=1 Tax=Rhizobium lusitanum TaxID=293958 RepID=A0A7X0ISX3_9HYPH|nr:hypothetical protein [Rhizobium lusitanum]MBB6486570.1 hypothetical protein [Rhizobium lusitanum]